VAGAGRHGRSWAGVERAAAARSDVRPSGPGCLMPHFWMNYRDSGRLVGVVIMDAPSLIQAGLKAIRGVGAGATFADGHELTADQVALVPAGKIGRMLSADEAERLLANLEAPRTERPRQPEK
jgi:hypothetical protein